MSRPLDPVQTSVEIVSAYRRYLGSLIAAREPHIASALKEAIDNSPLLDQGPFLEATPPYVTGASLQALIHEGVLCPAFADLDSPSLPFSRPLYAHQEESIRKVRDGRNVVVATGTGSGKTESFLLPILDSLVREQQAGTLGPGVRALLLYPMNALANDQMKRLRALLSIYPSITFGRYTGDTENTPQAAREAFAALNPSETPLPNELLSREEMRATPPNILLTNYAMLEYLLLRPQDVELFSSGPDGTWRFLAIDEAHVYDGTQGAEIAMLIRRLRDRVASDRPLQCIATSATVGAQSNPQAVTEFATRLFGQSFEWDDVDPQHQDLITARRAASPEGPFWGPLDAAAYTDLASAPCADDAVLGIAHQHGFVAAEAASAIAHEQRLATLRRTLAEGPKPFKSLVGLVFGDDPRGAEGLVAMVALASRLRSADGSPALSARYHLFLRATEGAFVCLSDAGPHVHLARHERCEECGSAVFELGACRRCGAVHLLGSIEPVEGRPALRHRRQNKPTSWLVLGDGAQRVDEDEEISEAAEVGFDQAMLCTQCGVLSSQDAKTCEQPDCASGALRPVKRLRKGGLELAGCLVCGARGEGSVRAFETGSDAAGAVLTTSLYQNLPPSGDPSDAQRPGEGRKLLMFSDSRQAAAFFAPYLEDTYRKLQRRRLVVQGLVGAGADEQPVFAEDLVFHTRASAGSAGVFGRRDSRQQQERAVAPWVMAEAVSVDDRQSLEGVGLLRITLDRDPAWPVPTPLAALGLTSDEAWDFMSELVRTLRLQGALTMPEGVQANDEVFAPRLGPIYARLTGPDARRKVLSWLPARGTNRRIDYTARVLAALGSTADPAGVLDGVWRFLTSANGVDWLSSDLVKGLGEVRQVDHNLLRFELASSRAPVFVCDTCQRTAPVAVRRVCPALNCTGHLIMFVPPPEDAEQDHYRSIYRSMLPVPLRAMEHTAQWQNTEAARIQQEFIRGDLNALSCSTTFELGVDVGELQAVVLRNMPPTTANYVQRAGRAGRRAGAAALVVTYAQRRSHDLTHFANPTSMMAGVIRAPYVPLENQRIDKRHAFSVALSAFFRWDLQHFHRISRNAGEFFIGEPGSEPPVAAVRAFLTPVPAGVRESLHRVLPASVRDEVGIDDDTWVADLLQQLDQVRAELSQDIHGLGELESEAVANKQYDRAARFQRVVQTVRGRELLGFLANHNLIPKYGFPVDTVELRTNLAGAAGAKLELSRDLSQAIHEYAPGATLVAGGQLWTSRGLYRLAGKDLEEFQYHVCESCGHYWEALADLDAQCPVCHRVAASTAAKLVIPEFGFVAEPEPKRPGARPPRSAWSGATHVVKLSDEARERTYLFPGGVVHASVGPRGRLVSVGDGPASRGYWLCEWCGWGTPIALAGRPPREHTHLLRAGRTCTGKLSAVHLGHRYETDVLSLDIQAHGHMAGEASWKSTLYAILEAASETLQIARDDIGGTIRPTGPTSRSLVLFDTVPGGGGNVLHIADRLNDVLIAALRRVTNCECGPETSCYGCLRGYRNQRDHELLSRGAAADFLVSLGVDRGRSQGGAEAGVLT